MFTCIVFLVGYFYFWSSLYSYFLLLKAFTTSFLIYLCNYFYFFYPCYCFYFFYTYLYSDFYFFQTFNSFYFFFYQTRILLIGLSAIRGKGFSISLLSAFYLFLFCSQNIQLVLIFSLILLGFPSNTNLIFVYNSIFLSFTTIDSYFFSFMIFLKNSLAYLFYTLLYRICSIQSLAVQ